MLRRIAFYLCVLQLAAISPLFAQSRDPVALWFWAEQVSGNNRRSPEQFGHEGGALYRNLPDVLPTSGRRKFKFERVVP